MVRLCRPANGSLQGAACTPAQFAQHRPNHALASPALAPSPVWRAGERAMRARALMAMVEAVALREKESQHFPGMLVV